jgi:hypothetical protein
MTNYDVIGDVHGHADRLIGLLRTMGYAERNGAWRHPDREAIFVGDLIDRGPQQLETIDIVRHMVDAGTGRVIAGNHEFNAVAYATPSSGGGHLRPRTPKNDAQHAAFIAAVGSDSALHRELVAWFMTMPLWLELDGLRVIHACWSDEHIDHLRPLVSEHDTLTEQLVVDASTETHRAYESIETLLKGPEVELPYGMTFRDKGNHERHRVRLKWWDDAAITWRDLLGPDEPIFDADGNPIDALPDEPIPPHLSKRYTGDVPVIFGHYWFEAPLEVTNPLALCVDYSAGAGRPLAAYRYDGEPRLRADRLVSF